MTSEQIVEIVSAQSPHGLQVTAWIMQILVFLALLVGTFYAKGQLDHMRADSDQSRKISQARLMLDLDTRWDSPDMQITRQLFARTNIDIGKIVSQEKPLAKDSAKAEIIKEKWAEHLGKLREEDINSYTSLMAMCGFFETVGIMVDRDYLSKEDMFALFLGPIIAIERCYSGHIYHRSQEEGVPEGLYRHALDICNCAIREHQS